MEFKSQVEQLISSFVFGKLHLGRVRDTNKLFAGLVKTQIFTNTLNGSLLGP